MRRMTIILTTLLLLFGYTKNSYPAFIEKIGIIEDTSSRLKLVIKSKFNSYNAVLLSHPFRLIIDFKGFYIRKNQKKLLKPKGKIISRIYIGNRKKGARIIFYSARRSGFRYRINSKGEYIIVTCWPKRKVKVRTGEYMDLPRPKRRIEKLLSSHRKKRKAEIDLENTKIPTYTGKKISLEFYKADLHNVFRLFSEVSGKNIIVSDKVKGTITMSLKNVPWDFALDLILEVQNLKKEERLNTYIITPIEKKEKGKGELIVKKVSRDTIHLARALKKREEKIRNAQQIIRKAYELEKRGKVNKALLLYEKATELWKDNADLLKKTAYLYYTVGNFARAYYYANRALKINPDDSEASLYGALSAVKLSKDEDARLLFDMAIKGEPKIPEAYYDYALFLEKRGKDFIHALAVYEEYEDLFGPILQTSLSIARLYSQLGEKQKACDKYREILLSGFKISSYLRQQIEKNIDKLCGKRSKL